MPETKYSKHLIREPFHKATEDFGGATIFKHTNEDESGSIYEYHCINKADWSINDGHTHDRWELLCFVGGNPRDINDLGAEVHIQLGVENEEHILTSATVVSIPSELKHGPITIKNYSKPFILLRILTTKEYENILSEHATDTDVFGVKAMSMGYEGDKYGIFKFIESSDIV